MKSELTFLNSPFEDRIHTHQHRNEQSQAKLEQLLLNDEGRDVSDKEWRLPT